MANLQKFPVGTTPSGDIDRRLRDLLTQSIRRCGKSREQIANDMSRILAPRQVTIHQLNSWTATSHDTWRFPAAYLSAFCLAVGDDAAIRFLLGSRLSALLTLGEVVARAVPAAVSRFENTRLRRATSDDSQKLQELLFG